MAENNAKEFAAKPAKNLPTRKTTKKNLPVTGNEENTVVIGGQTIEIKPTKLK